MEFVIKYIDHNNQFCKRKFFGSWHDVAKQFSILEGIPIEFIFSIQVGVIEK